jgi:putative inorganic carbon (HCO3(-)) transporter
MAGVTDVTDAGGNTGTDAVRQRPSPSAKVALTGHHLYTVAVAAIAVIGGLLILVIPEKYQLSVVFAVPGVIVGLMIIMNPFIGMFMYILFEYLRPYDIVPALLYLRVPILVISLSTFAWILKFAKTRKVYWNRISWMYLGWVALVGFTVVSADNYYYALRIFKEAVIVFAVFVVATNVVDTYKRLNWLVWLMIGIHGYLALKGIHNYLSGFGVTGGHGTSGVVGTSFLADENDFALTLNMMIPFVFFAFVYAKRFYVRILSIGILLTLVFGVVSSFSRGGWVGLVVAIAYCIFRSRRRLLSFGIAGVLAAVLVVAAPSEYWSEIETISDTGEATAATRLNYWHAGIKMFLDYPIVGVGAGNGGAYMPQYVTGYADPGTQWGRAFHGTIPQVMAELGIIGISLFLGMVYFVFTRLGRLRKQAFKKRETGFLIRFSDSIMGGMLAYLASATFLSTAYYPQFWTMITFATIIMRIEYDKRRVEVEPLSAARSNLELSGGPALIG